VPQILLSDSFLDALADLDATDVKRAAAFLDKFVRAPATASLRPEIVHDAADRSVRSFKVTHDLRAIARIDGEQVLMLYVARHDRTYEWARTHCVNCHPVTGELLVVKTARGGEPELCAEEGAKASDSSVAAGDALSTQACSTSQTLRRILDERGIRHGLRV